MATYQILYLLSIPLILAAQYRFARNELLRDRYDRWFNNLSLGFINEALLLALDLSGYWLTRISA
ncbi:hypothetical protein [Marinobacter subterrani]|uniref:Uncharacterized protein n=1 Tax=Marinobacter subterrani TaxID=1658765 RepID=A0A0J7JDK6_9GAMM|nr:hypothetical protein [Marinobacter subterrani]KMQ75959.1 hypothetical protein Msub_12168 [Marinobacter subterrani]